jgi:hypothetical protein
MANFGFGPTGALAVKVRPTTGVVDPYGVQTWFQDASAAGKQDGTIITASWLNQFIAERLILAIASDTPVHSNIGTDDFLLNAVIALIGKKIAAAALTGPQAVALINSGLGSQAWQTNPTALDIIGLVDGALGTDWRDVTPTVVDQAITTAINNLKASVGSAFDTLQEIEAALGGDPNLAATLTAAITAERLRAQAIEATFTTIASVVNNLTAGGAAVPLSAQQGVVLKSLIDAITANLATEAVTRGSADGALTAAIASEAATRATNDTTNANAISAEASTRATADTLLATNLATEMAARAAADALLVPIASIVDALTSTLASVPLSANQGRVLSNLIATLTTALATEVTNRTAGDTTNATAISAEVVARTAADALLVPISAIVNNLTAGGTTVPLSAEQGKVLNQLILTGIGSSETYLTIAARDAAPNINNGDIAYVVNNGSSTWELFVRTSGAWQPLLSGTSLSSAVAGALMKDGTVAATANIPMGGHKLTGLAAGTATGDSARWDELAAEATARLTGDNANATAITAEGSVRATADTTLQANITAEATTRAAADAAAASLSGVAALATNLGTFTGAVIPDNASIKAALQALETKTELAQSVGSII